MLESNKKIKEILDINLEEKAVEYSTALTIASILGFCFLKLL